MDNDDEARTAPMPTQVAGRYRLGEVIGRGGMAEVYRALDTKLSRDVAVKILLDTAGDESDRARFIGEARTLAMLSHSALVTIFDAGFGPASSGGGIGDQPFLVMELVEGQTLGRLIAAGPLPLEQVGDIGVQVADGLAYVHDRGVVHRDVKPGNVLVSDGDRVKLADFGIARLVEQATRHTRTSHAIGTAAYLSPEQVQGGDVHGAADIYSLGLVLLEAITGRREYTGSTAETALARLSRAPRIPEDLPAAWQDLLRAMTALDAADRPSAEEVASAIRANLGHLAPLPTVGTPDPMTTPILAGQGPEAPPPTQVLTEVGLAPTAAPPSGPPPSSPPPSSPPPSGPPPDWTPSTPPARPARPTRPPRPARSGPSIAERLRALPPSTLGVVGSMAALVILLIALAVVADDTEPELPANTPTDLRGPLSDLHEAVNGEDG